MSILFDLNVKLTGTEAIIDKLSKLADKMQKKIARKGARKGMAIVRNAAIANAKRFDDGSTPEKIYKNVVVQEAPRTSKRIGGICMRVGVRGGAKQYSNTKDNQRKHRVGKSFNTGGSSENPGGDTWYWRFKEFGTSKLSAKPFLRAAINSHAQGVADAVANSINQDLDKEIK